MLDIRLLGDIELSRDGEVLALPPSRKTRALLAYLVLNGQPHRRERLCTLLWDIPDDPRGALRWSLSKLRGLVDEPDQPRIIADRESVAFDSSGITVDVVSVRDRFANGLASLTTDQLEVAAGSFRGEFLQGLDLTDLHDFHAWTVSEREEARSLHARVLNELVSRSSAEPASALTHARALVGLDPFEETARATLIRLLAAAGHREEAEQQFLAGSKLLDELGAESSGQLMAAWKAARVRPGSTPAPEPPPAKPASKVSAILDAPEFDEVAVAQPAAFVGRSAELEHLTAALEDVISEGQHRAVLITGDPGVGKTRLIGELIAMVRAKKGTVFDGRAYEAEIGRPYGPWIDALRRLPADAVGGAHRGALAPLLPELAEPAPQDHSRDRLLTAVVDLVAAHADNAGPVLVALDDVQWCDDSSAELLHFVARKNRKRPVFLVLGARDGELPDNVSMIRALRRLRQDGLLDELNLGPLAAEDIGALVQEVAPGIDVDRVFEESAGNPLFALEVARSLPQRQDEVPQTLTDLVRERLDRLPASARDVLRWAAVLGQSFSASTLAELVAMDLDALVSALETLERRALLASVDSARVRITGDAYGFSHDLVRRVVYDEMSAPRRRLMHRQVATTLNALEDVDKVIAGDVARHAAMAGEASMAALACVRAAHSCLRLFANREADSLARRGMKYAEQLREPKRVKRMLELSEIRLVAVLPEDLEAFAKSIEDLAEQALDHGFLNHARLGFQILSYLRWEEGDWSRAQRSALRAELVSRSTDEKGRVIAMSEAARCLALLERDLGQAEAMALEARALSERTGVESIVLWDAMGMLRLHQGQLDDAARFFEDAWSLSRRDRDHAQEYQTLENLVVLEIQRGRNAEAVALSAELLDVASKFREGSEAPFARALHALARYAGGDRDASADLEDAVDELRLADAKYRLAYTLTRSAEIDLLHGDHEIARSRADEALVAAERVTRPSEIALAHIILVRAARALGDAEAAETHFSALTHDSLRGTSLYVRDAANGLRAESAEVEPEITATGD